jgi:WD40 repeat protein
MGTIRFRHGDAVFHVAVSPDGRLIASGDMSGEICVWQANDGRRTLQLKKEQNRVSGLAFSPDGKTLLSSGVDGSLRLTDIRTGKDSIVFRGPSDTTVRAIAYSPSGDVVASASEHEIDLWDAKSGKRVFTLKKAGASLISMSFSPTGNLLALGEFNGVVRVWNLRKREECLRLNGHISHAFSVAFSADEKMLVSAGGDENVKVWDRKTGRILLQLKGSNASYHSAGFSPDGSMVYGAGDGGYLTAWSVPGGKRLLDIRCHNHTIFSASISSDGRFLVTGSSDQSIKLWDARTGKQLLRFPGHYEYITNLVFSHNNSALATMAWGGVVNVWETSTGRHAFSIPGKKSPPVTFLFSDDDSQLVLARADGSVEFWDVLCGTRLRTVTTDQPDPHSLLLPLNGEQVIVAGEKRVCAWGIVSGKGKELYSPKKGKVTSAALSEQQEVLVSVVDDKTVTVNNIRTGREVARRRGDYQQVFLMDGQTLALVSDGSIAVHFLQTGKSQDCGPWTDFVYTLSPDRKLLALGSQGGALGIYEIASGLFLRESSANSDSVYHLRFSPNGKYVAAGYRSGSVVVWDVFSPAPHPLSEGNRASVSDDALWGQLGDQSPEAAYDTIGFLIRHPDRAVALFEKRIHPVPNVPSCHITELIDRLRHKKVSVRDESSRALVALSEAAIHPLRQALSTRPDLEQRRRIEAVLRHVMEVDLATEARRIRRTIGASISKADVDPELHEVVEDYSIRELFNLATARRQLRESRAVLVLEQIATPSFRRVLERLSKGHPDARLTQLARDALRRLSARARAGWGPAFRWKRTA